MKLDFLKLKAKQAADEAENTAAGGATKAVDAMDGAIKHAPSTSFGTSTLGQRTTYSYHRCQRRNPVTPPLACYSSKARAP